MANKAHLYSENYAFNGSCSANNEFAFNQQQQYPAFNQQQQYPLQFVTQQQLQLPLQNVMQQQLQLQNVQQQLPVQNVTQQQQQQLNQFNGNQNLFTDIGDLFSASTENNIYFQTGLARNLVSQVEKQRQDMQQYINLQSEGFKLVLQQQLPIFFKEMQSTIGMLLKRKDEELAEAKNKIKEVETFGMLLKRKDEELAEAKNKIKEVETFAIKLESEKQAWKKIAYEKVGLILQLNNTVQQLREKCSRFNGMDNEADDAVSYCDENMEGTPKLQLCQCCKSENAHVIFFPCRHLCTCKVCHVFYEFCPVCSLEKEEVLEAVLP